MHAVTPRKVATTRDTLASLMLTLWLAACGGGGDAVPTPPDPVATSYTVGVTITSPVGTGESFQFVLGSQSITLTASALSATFTQALAGGSSYNVNQTVGPRACTLSANRNGNLGANVQVSADCGAPPGASRLTGELRGPVGTQVVLQRNGGDDLALTIPPFTNGTAPYNLLDFQFATALPDGSAYQVTVKAPPAGQTCTVYKGATGTTPVALGAVRVGCEWNVDHVSRSTTNAVLGTYFDSSAPAIGGAATAVGTTNAGYGEGRFVAFVSSAVMGGNAAGLRQVFWRDRLTGETLLLSASAAGVPGNGDSFAPAISADGLVVAFESHASNLVSADGNGVRDVFVWSAQDQSAGVQRVSLGPAGAEANSASFEPSLSGDGRVVAFSSGASNLTTGVSGIGTINVFRRDRTTGSNTLVSANSAGTGVGGSRPALSQDGNRLAFHSFAADIVAGDGNGLWDIFVHDHASATRTRVSLTDGGGERNQGTESASRVVAPAISGNGQFVAFATTASNMVPGDTNGLQDVFVVNTQSGAVQRASVATGGAQGNGDSPIGQGERPSLSFDGSRVGFSTAASNLGPSAGNAVMHHRPTGETRALSSGAGGVGPVVLSRSAAYAVFGAASALDPRFPSTGLFAAFTGAARAWWWID